VRKYLRAGDDVNERNQLGGSALVVAAQYDHVEVVRTLLRHPYIAINLQDHSGETALMKASSEGHARVVKTLCKRPDVNVNIQDNEGWTTLMHARGKVGIVKIILKQRSLDMKLTDETGCNAFQLACSKGWTKVVTAMVRSERAIQQLTKDDLTCALGLAKANNYAAIAKIVSKAACNRESRKMKGGVSKNISQ